MDVVVYCSNENVGQGEYLRDRKKECLNLLDKDDNVSEIIEYTRTTFKSELNLLLSKIKKRKIKKLITFNPLDIGNDTREALENILFFIDSGCKFLSVELNIDSDDEAAVMTLRNVYDCCVVENKSIAPAIVNRKYLAAKEGYWFGGQNPYGYINKDKVEIIGDKSLRYIYLEEVKEEVDVVKFIFDKFHEIKSYCKLENILADKGIKARKGGVFRKTTIKGIISSTVYVKYDEKIEKYLLDKGFYITNKEYGKGVILYSNKVLDKTEGIVKIASTSIHDGLIDSELWLKSQNIINS